MFITKKSWNKLTEVAPKFSIKGFVTELIEFVQSPSVDELGDVLFMLGIMNKWSLRKITFRRTYSLVKLRHLRFLSRSKFFGAYVEKSKKDGRQALNAWLRSFCRQDKVQYIRWEDTLYTTFFIIPHGREMLVTLNYDIRGKMRTHFLDAEFKSNADIAHITTDESCSLYVLRGLSKGTVFRVFDKKTGDFLKPKPLAI